MESSYSAAQPYPLYCNPQWSQDVKPEYLADKTDLRIEEDTLDADNATDAGPSIDDRRPSMLRTEDDYAVASHSAWHDRSQSQHAQLRHYSHSHSHPHVHGLNGHDHQIMQLHASNYAATMHQQQPQAWSVPQSGSNTPTPMYGSVDGYGQHVSFTAPPPPPPPPPPPTSYRGFQSDPLSAVSMSPQSSQGGWNSNNSSDDTDRQGMLKSPTYRPTSPTTVVRSDGIRKKNARFEIPKERNLANIDAMILASTDEAEKKELKQQKRLLRNRQAALDSRQRKKTHTEKLEQEKKVHERKVVDLEDALTRTENALSMEREGWMQQQRQLEHVIHSVQYDRDEAIRTKTIETAELRRQNNILKDMVRDLERQCAKGYTSASDLQSFHGEMDDFGIAEDSYEDGFGFLNGEEFKVEDSSSLAGGQTTPKGPTVQVADRQEAGFSWNTFYMCLLFGAFIAANSTGSRVADADTTSVIASSISPSEAGNVLKAVLKSKSGAAPIAIHDPVPGMATHAEGSVAAEPSAFELGPVIDGGSTLDTLHQTLSMPTRQQEMVSAFSLSASSYNHINDPFNEHIHHDGDPHLLAPPRPSQLQQAWAKMQAETNERERINGISSKVRERSLLWDHIPPEVVKNFEELVRKGGGVAIDGYESKMEH